MQFLGAFAVVAAIVFALFGFLKYIVEYRRWHRTAKQNAEVHNKILDRFGSNEELLAYIDSPAGRRFLEATRAIGIFVPTFRKAWPWMAERFTTPPTFASAVPADPLASPVGLAAAAAILICLLVGPVVLYVTLRDN